MLSWFGILLSGLLLGCLLLIKSRGSKSVEVQSVWEIYDDRLQFMSRQDALLLDESLDAGDVSQAWLVWSGAAETALADAYRFSGGPSPNRGLVLGRGKARFRLVRLGGHKVRKVRGDAADVHDAADVFLYRDSSIAPLLDMRLRFRAVLNVLDSMISHGVTLSRSVELYCPIGQDLAHWASLPYRCWMIFMLLRVLVLGISGELLVISGVVISITVFAAFIVVFAIFFILSLFIDGMRPSGGGETGCGKIPWFTRISGSGQI